MFAFVLSVTVTTAGIGYYVTLAANTTIGNNITTSGSLTVGSSSLFSGAVNASSTLQVTGAVTLYGGLTSTGTGTSTFSGGIQITALNVTSSTATSTFTNGIQLSSGCFRLPDGTCAGNGSGSGTVNSGTQGQISFYNSTGTTISGTSTVFISTAGNIGIGTSTPQWNLQVAGDKAKLTLSDTSAGTDKKHWTIASEGGNLYFATSTDSTYATSSYSILRINSDFSYGAVSVGRPGAGTDSTPSSTFNVFGSGFMSSSATGASTVLRIQNPTTAADNTEARLAMRTSVAGGSLDMASIGGLTESNSNSKGALVIYTRDSSSSFTEKARISSAGNLGVGTTTPSQRLAIQGNALFSGDLSVANLTATGTLTVSGSSGTSTIASGQGFVIGGNKFAVQQGSGYVGIGTSTPLSPLHISSNQDSGILIIETYGADSGFGPAVSGFSAGGSAEVPIATAANQDLLFIGGRGYQTTTGAFGAGSKAAIRFQSSEAWTSTAQGTNIRFETATNGGTSRTVKMLLANDGNLGIGTTNPTSKLEVTGSSIRLVNGSDTRLIFDNTNHNWQAGSDTNGDRFFVLDEDSNTTPLVIAYGAVDNLLYLTGNNVGIGTTTPSQKLAVQGGGLFSGNLTAANMTATGTLTASGLFTFGNASGTQLTTTGSTYLATSGGNVGLGTGAPVNKLTVSGNANFTGNVGIGVASPSNTLAIAADTSVTALQINGNDGSSQPGLSVDNGNQGYRIYHRASPTGSLGNGPSLDCDALNSGSGCFISRENVLTLSIGSGRLGVNTQSINNELTVSGSADFSGNVGIGTTTPSQKLAVQGNALFSGNISVASITATGTLTASGLFTFGNASGTQLTTTGNVYLATGGGNVGIGTASPSAKLVVADGDILRTNSGAPYANSTIRIGSADKSNWRSNTVTVVGLLSDSTANSTSFNGWFGQATGKGVLVGADDGGYLGSGGVVGGVPNLFLAADTNGTVSITGEGGIILNNNTGIGTTSPWATLAVEMQNGSTPTFVVSDNGTSSPRLIVANTGNVGIGTTSPSRLFSVHGSGLFSGDLSVANLTATGTLNVSGLLTFGNASGTQLTTTGSTYLATTGGNVGIGTDAPANKLSVSGNTNISGNLGVGANASAPGYPLHVRTTASATLLRLENSFAGTIDFAPAASLPGDSTVAFGFITESARWTHSAHMTSSQVADTYAISHANGFGILIDGSGRKFGIGTTSPSQALAVHGNALFSGNISSVANITATGTLSLTGTSGTSTIASGQGFTVGTSQFVVQQGSGNVGIGTTTPIGKLSVSATAGTAGLFVGAGGGADAMAIVPFAAGSGAALQSTNETGGSYAPLTLRGSTVTLGIGASSAVSINASGNVGIGTTTPDVKFTVSKTHASAATIAKFENPAASGLNGSLYIRSRNDAGGINAMHIDAGDASDLTALPLYLNSGGGKIITGSGNVGIGTTTPSQTLAVQGNALFSGSLSASNITATGTLTLGNSAVNARIISANNSLEFRPADGTSRFYDGSTNEIVQIYNAGTIGIQMAGNGLTYFDTGGNFGIGTSSPASKLAVSGGVSIGVNYNFAAPTNGLIIEGNVGIGTTTPSQALAVQGNALFSGNISSVANITATGTITLSGGSLYTPNGQGVSIRNNANTAHRVALSRNSADQTYISGNSIGLYVNDESVQTNAVTINSSGNVGIGTTTPGSLLALHSGSDFINFGVTSTSTFSKGINLLGGCIAVNGTCISGGAGSGTVNTGLTGQFPYYAADGTAVSATSTLFVSTGSNIGIGTTTPTYKLTVAGKTAAFNSAADGSLDAWATNSNPLPLATYNQSSVTANGYVYVIGGSDGAATTTVRYAKLNSDGSIGSWVTNSNALPAVRRDHTSVTANGYVYVIGGHTDAAAQSTVYYAKLNSDGSIGAWSTNSNALPAIRYVHGSVAANGFVYVMGGNNDSGNQFTVYYAKLNSNGSTGAWASAETIPQVRAQFSTVVANGYVYVIGGAFVPTAQSTVYYAKLKSDGSVGSWFTNANALPSALYEHTSVVANGYLYVMGGSNGSAAQSAVYYAKLNSDGSTGTWSTNSNALPAVRFYHSSVTANGYVYAIGGNNGTTGQSTVYYASTARVSISGDLDLLGLASTTLGDVNSSDFGSVGGSIFAGNIFSAGRLEVTNGANILGGVGIEGSLTIRATTSGLQTNSVFSVMNATGTSPIITALYNGNVGISSTSPLYKLSVGGTVAFDGLTSVGITEDALCLSVNKEVQVNTGAATCTLSSKRFKYDIQDSSAGLSLVMQLRPVSFKNNGTDEERLGLIAEEVNEVEPRLAVKELDGSPRGVRYEELTSVLVKAVQEQQAQIASLTSEYADFIVDATKAWLESMQIFIENGLLRVKDFVAETVTAKKVVTDGFELKDSATGEIYCVKITNGEWDKAPGECAVTNTTDTNTTPATDENTSSTTPIADTIPPTITLNGDSTISIEKGTGWVDPGATVLDPANGDTPENPNLSIYYQVDGQPTGNEGRDLPQTAIDTNISGSHVITYSAADSAGNTGTAQRTLNITDPAPTPSPEPSPEPEPTPEPAP